MNKTEKRNKFKKIIKEMLSEDDSFLNALTGSEVDYNNVLNKINDRARKINDAIKNATKKP